MRSCMFLAGVSLALLLAPAPARGGVAVSISFGTFYSSLDPYGEWIAVGDGAYAWHPAGMEGGWRPYTRGHWEWTDEGWYWVSDEPWGWACFHYGRWYDDDTYGWLWVPGYDWSPAWVDWRFGGGCVGWAPLSPYAVFRVGFGIHYRRHWVTPPGYWSFMDSRHFGTGSVHRFIYRSDENIRLMGRTRSAGSIGTEGGRIVSRGPDRSYVERTGNVRVRRAEIVDVGSRNKAGGIRGGSGDRIETFRPAVQARQEGAPIERPGRVRASARAASLDMTGTDLGVRRVGLRREAAMPRRGTPTPRTGLPGGSARQDRVRRVEDRPHRGAGRPSHVPRDRVQREQRVRRPLPGVRDGGNRGLAGDHGRRGSGGGSKNPDRGRFSRPR